MKQHLSRRRFLETAAASGLGAGLLAVMPGCGSDAAPESSNDQQGDATPNEPATREPVEDAAPPTEWGDLRGRFIYDGVAPEREKLTVDKDVDCCGRFDIRDESLLVGPDGGLANVYVYLPGRAAYVHPELEEAAPEQVLLDNLDCIFQPHCMKIWVGPQTLHIVNSDPVAQNVAFSPPFDVAANIVLEVGKEATWTFRRGQREPIAIACNYHPWESAYILPLEHPYVDISAEDGTFTIRKLPVGRHKLRLWHERPKSLLTPASPDGRLTVDIRPGDNDLGDIVLPPALFEKP